MSYWQAILFAPVVVLSMGSAPMLCTFTTPNPNILASKITVVSCCASDVTHTGTRLNEDSIKLSMRRVTPPDNQVLTEQSDNSKNDNKLMIKCLRIIVFEDVVE